MSVWERIDSNGDAHALTQAQDKLAKQKFRALMDATVRRREWEESKRVEIDEDPDHIILGGQRKHGTSVTPHGDWRELHGTVCTCCPRRKEGAA